MICTIANYCNPCFIDCMDNRHFNKQKNQLENIMGFGCGMLLCMNLLMNAGITLGLIPDTSSFMPFFSAGRSNIILSYAITGIILSIYKYQNVYTANVRVIKKDRETA